MKEKIREFAKTLGIDTIGFSSNSVVALFPYYVKGEKGNISMYARGIDYHIIVEEKLAKLSEYIRELGATETLVHVDKGGLNDRKAAFDAGLGFMGKNSMLISPKYGSYFFIGQVVHNLDIEKDTPMTERCLSCGACEKNCPGGALKGKEFDISLCLSDITQKKGELSIKEEMLIKNNDFCWGCDICQSVCPHNKELETTAIPEFLADRIESLRPQDVETLSNREFKEKYGKYAFSWRGKAPLERNLKLLLKKERL